MADEKRINETVWAIKDGRVNALICDPSRNGMLMTFGDFGPAQIHQTGLAESEKTGSEIVECRLSEISSRTTDHDEKRIERARDWYEKQDGMTPTPEFMADFAESELNALPANLDIRNKVEAILSAYILQHQTDADGGTLHLVDLLTPADETSITKGKEEIELIADEIAVAFVRTNPDARAIAEKIATELITQTADSFRVHAEDIERIVEPILSAELARDWNVIAEVGLPEADGKYEVTRQLNDEYWTWMEFWTAEQGGWQCGKGIASQIIAYRPAAEPYRPQIQEASNG